VQLDKASNALSSITTLSALTRNQNVALIGEELIIFETATLVQPGVYELTGLHRGIRGTDHASASHTAYERFVLLSGVAQRIELENTYLGLSAQAKFVQDRASLDEVEAKTVQYVGNAYKPYSVANLAASQISPGDWRLTWIRRTRLDGEWRDGADVPLAEQSEAYLIEILDGDELLQSIETTSPLAVITAEPGNTARVFQISTTVGRGWPSEITLS